MGILRILLEDNKRDIMISRIGLPEEVVDRIERAIPKKYRIWVANNILATVLSAVYQVNINDKSTYQSLKAKWEKEKRESNDFRTHRVYKELKSFANNREEFITEYYYNFIRVIANGNFVPKLDIKQIYTFEEVQRIQGEFITIRDWYVAQDPKPNIRAMEWEEAFEIAEEWHNAIARGENVGSSIALKEGQEVITTYDDGYYWVDLGTNHCDDEGESMGHCGNTGADTLLSLRDGKHVPHVTVAYDYDGTYRQMKGKGNTKPVEKYHAYIIDLFIKEHKVDFKDYQITSFEPEYQANKDFNLLDLSDELLLKVKKEIPKVVFENLLSDIDYEIILKRLDFEANISLPYKYHANMIKVLQYLEDYHGEYEPSPYDHANIIGAAEHGILIPLLVKTGILKNSHSNLKYLGHVQYPTVPHSTIQALVPFITNDEPLIILTVNLNNYNIDLFFTR